MVCEILIYCKCPRRESNPDLRFRKPEIDLYKFLFISHLCQLKFFVAKSVVKNLPDLPTHQLIERRLGVSIASLAHGSQLAVNGPADQVLG